VPPLLWATIWWIFIDDRPSEARWIRPQERDYIEHTISEEAQRTERPHLDTYGRAFLSPVTWLFAIMYFFSTIPGYGISSFFPSLLENAGFSFVVIGGLTALPFVMAIVGLVLVGILSDRHLKRRLFIAVPMIILGVGLIVGAALHAASLPVSLAIFILAGFGLYAYLGPFWASVSQMLPTRTAGGSMGLINAVGNLGGFAGPFIVGFLNSRSGNFVSGFIFLGASALVVALLTLLMRLREGQGAGVRKLAEAS
jgi:nitrate/nitrite transporter NarK